MAEEKDKKQETAAAAADTAAVKGGAGAAVDGDQATGADAAAKPEEKASAAPQAKRVRMRGAVSAGIAHIRATFNNTIVSITDMHGAVISWSSAGRAGFKGSRKSTAFAATMVAQDVARQAVGRGMHEVEVRVQGAGSGRESAIRALQSAGLSIAVIKDVTPMAHNGCRPRKRRRV